MHLLRNVARSLGDERDGLKIGAIAIVALLVIDAALASLDADRFTPAWYAALGALCLASIVVVGFVLAACRRVALERIAARFAEARSTVRRARIAALRELLGTHPSDVDQRLGAMLRACCTVMRPGKRIFGYASHVADDVLVVDATSAPADGIADWSPSAVAVVGESVPLEKTLEAWVDPFQTTAAWNTRAELPPATLSAEAGSALVHTFRTAGETHFLTVCCADELTADPFTDDDGAMLELMGAAIEDDRKQRWQLERFRYESDHDGVTDLPNRTVFRRVARAAIAAGEPFALVIVDLDHFRELNGRHGHVFGDAVLAEIASGLTEISHAVQPYRLSGDRFGLMLHEVIDEEDLVGTLERYADLFRRPFRIGDAAAARTCELSASLGAARFPQDGESYEEVLRRTEVAVDTAKAQGGGMTVLFSAELQHLVEAQQLRREELIEAIERNEFVMYYQPTFALSTSAPAGAEALIRWNHPERGILAPAAFLGDIERVGLIERITRWVVDRVIEDVGKLVIVPDGFRCYFNLPPQLLDSESLLADMRARLGAIPMLTNWLGVEVTETAVMRDHAAAARALDAFRSLGLRIAIDDFGTGYSSLAQLKRLPIDVLKLDRSFVMGLPDDEKDEALCDLLLRVGQRFGMKTLAEGVETQEQADWLTEHGCVIAQGYLFARPMPYANFVQVLRNEVAVSLA